MHTESAIVDSFDVFLHTVNDGFLRLAKDLDDVEYDTTLPAANALTWSLWDGSERYNRAKGATANKSLAKLEFEAGSGANYVQRLTSEALYAAERKEIATLTLANHGNDLTFPKDPTSAGSAISNIREIDAAFMINAQAPNLTLSISGDHYLQVGDKITLANFKDNGIANGDKNDYYSNVEVVEVVDNAQFKVNLTLPAAYANIHANHALVRLIYRLDSVLYNSVNSSRVTVSGTSGGKQDAHGCPSSQWQRRPAERARVGR